MTQLTAEKQRLLEKMNQDLAAEHRAAEESAQRKGKPAPQPPALLTPHQIEFPKYLHKGWEETDHAPGHHIPKESKLAHNEEEAKALELKGYTEAPTLAKHKAVEHEAPKAKATHKE